MQMQIIFFVALLKDESLYSARTLYFGNVFRALRGKIKGGDKKGNGKQVTK